MASVRVLARARRRGGRALPRLGDPGDGVCPPPLRFLPARTAADLLVPDAATVPFVRGEAGSDLRAFLREEVVEPVGNAQWVFIIRKILRGYFLRNRELLGDLSRAAWETVRALMAEAAGEPGVRPGMVVVPQTFGNSVNAHPHVHAIASRGGWTKKGTWVPIPCKVGSVHSMVASDPIRPNASCSGSGGPS